MTEQRPLSTTLVVDAGLDLDHLAPGHRVRGVLESALARAPHPGRRPDPRAPAGPSWTAGFFGLERVTRFVEATDEEQARVLARAGASLLHEAYFIERLGLAYAAKMLLRSNTNEERMLYATIAADEARHLDAVSAYIDEADALGTESAFHRLLADLIEGGPPGALVFLIQVVLEGWGLTHYRGLAEGCARPDLGAALRGILEDEARHHGSGRVLLEERGLRDDERALAEDALATLLDMVRGGPQGVLAALDVELGGLSRAERVAALRELDAEGHSAERLALLGRLCRSEGAGDVAASLEARGCFAPLAPEAAA